MSISENHIYQSDLRYLEMQAEVGMTKHVGGVAATDELLSLYHIENVKEILNACCGIGAGVAYIARRFGCWMHERAPHKGVLSIDGFHYLLFKEWDLKMQPCPKVQSFDLPATQIFQPQAQHKQLRAL